MRGAVYPVRRGDHRPAAGLVGGVAGEVAATREVREEEESQQRWESFVDEMAEIHRRHVAWSELQRRRKRAAAECRIARSATEVTQCRHAVRASLTWLGVCAIGAIHEAAALGGGGGGNNIADHLFALLLWCAFAAAGAHATRLFTRALQPRERLLRDMVWWSKHPIHFLPPQSRRLPPHRRRSRRLRTMPRVCYRGMC